MDFYEVRGFLFAADFIPAILALDPDILGAVDSQHHGALEPRGFRFIGQVIDRAELDGYIISAGENPAAIQQIFNFGTPAISGDRAIESLGGILISAILSHADQDDCLISSINKSDITVIKVVGFSWPIFLASGR